MSVRLTRWSTELYPSKRISALGRSPDRTERLCKANRRLINLRQLAVPRRLIQPLQIGLVIIGELTLSAIIHDGERLVRAEQFTRPRSLGDLGEEDPKAKDVASFYVPSRRVPEGDRGAAGR